MSIVNDIVREQVIFLRPRGFGTLGMGNAEGPAMFERQLHEGLEKLLHSDDEWVTAMPVRAVNIGKFEKGKYTVQFTFDYEFEPIEQQLILKGIEAKLGDDTMPITMQDLREYRQPVEFFQKLKNLHIITDEHCQKEFQSTLAALLLKNKELLTKQGYTETSQGSKQNKGALERRLDRKLAWAAEMTTDKKPIQRFKLQTNGVFGKNKQLTHFTIYFEFNRAHPLLRPSSVTARLEGKPVVITCNSNVPLPSAETMYRLATGELDMKKMFALLQFKPDYSLRPAKGVTR
jgi:hypothetical protein